MSGKERRIILTIHPRGHKKKSNNQTKSGAEILTTLLIPCNVEVNFLHQKYSPPKK